MQTTKIIVRILSDHFRTSYCQSSFDQCRHENIKIIILINTKRNSIAWCLKANDSIISDLLYLILIVDLDYVSALNSLFKT